MRGMMGGILTGGLVSVFGLGAASLMSELPAGLTPPATPLVEAPVVLPNTVNTDETTSPLSQVGSTSIQEPQAPVSPDGEADSPDGEADFVQFVAPQPSKPDTQAPHADSTPLDEPQVLYIDGTMRPPDRSENLIVLAQPDDLVLPNPQSLAPETPTRETDLIISTTSAQPSVIVKPGSPEVIIAQDDSAYLETSVLPPDERFVVGLDVAPELVENVLVDLLVDEVTDTVIPSKNNPLLPRLLIQSGENTLLDDSSTSMILRRPVSDDLAAQEEIVPTKHINALVDFAAVSSDAGLKPMLSIILIDDGSMSAPALASLSFPVTIALDPSLKNAGILMAHYRNNGFEVAALAKLPDDAISSDVEGIFESFFQTLPETMALLDVGDSGLQTDQAVTDQVMDILASHGRGFVTVNQGLNMSELSAKQAGVPAAVVYRDLDSDNQDARVVRRFVDQAAFRAQQKSGVVLVGRVRPDTISALTLWGSARQDEKIAIVPLSTILNAQ
jgi:polysaccharide deacetylase 2 family uncharacterized protein YibQ